MGCGASRDVSVIEPSPREEESKSPADPKSNGWARYSIANSIGWKSESEILTPYMDDVWRLRGTMLSISELREFSNALSYGPRDLHASLVAFCKLAGPPGTSTISMERLCKSLDIPESQSKQNPIVRRFVAAVTPVGWGGVDFKTFAFCQRIFKASTSNRTRTDLVSDYLSDSNQLAFISCS